MKKTEIKNKWSLISMQTSVDINTNQLSVFNIVDEINVMPPKNPLPKLPEDGFVIPFQHEFVSFWSRDLNESKDEMKINAKLKLFYPLISSCLNKMLLYLLNLIRRT